MPFDKISPDIVSLSIICIVCCTWCNALQRRSARTRTCDTRGHASRCICRAPANGYECSWKIAHSTRRNFVDGWCNYMLKLKNVNTMFSRCKYEQHTYTHKACVHIGGVKLPSTGEGANVSSFGGWRHLHALTDARVNFINYYGWGRGTRQHCRVRFMNRSWQGVSRALSLSLSARIAAYAVDTRPNDEMRANSWRWCWCQLTKCFHSINSSCRSAFQSDHERQMQIHLTNRALALWITATWMPNRREQHTTGK